MAIAYSGGQDSGRPVVESSTCKVCGACAEICASGALKKVDGHIAVDTAVPFGCITCGQCMMVCPSGSVTVDGRRMRAADVVDLPPRDRRATADQLDALLLSRRSVRRFTQDEVSRELLDRIVASASTAPMGFPPSEVGIVVFQGRAKVRELSEDVARLYRTMVKYIDNPVVRVASRPFVKKASHEIFTTMMLPLAREVARANARGEDYILHDAPAALLFHTSPYSDLGDAMIVCTYAMVAAESLGLGTTMIGCLTPPMARQKALLQKYGLPAGHVPQIALIVGHPAVKYRKAIRRSFSSVNYY
jgi:nitroreductase/NAD-dependent dihydropyrimidine dehydrogenase PreA subunit